MHTLASFYHTSCSGPPTQHRRWPARRSRQAPHLEAGRQHVVDMVKVVRVDRPREPRQRNVDGRHIRRGHLWVQLGDAARRIHQLAEGRRFVKVLQHLRLAAAGVAGQAIHEAGHDDVHLHARLQRRTSAQQRVQRPQVEVVGEALRARRVRLVES